MDSIRCSLSITSQPVQTGQNGQKKKKKKKEQKPKEKVLIEPSYFQCIQTLYNLCSCQNIQPYILHRSGRAESLKGNHN